MPGVSRAGVYLLHFDRPYRHARHYAGWAEDIERRIGEHRAGRGSRLCAVIYGAWIGFEVARVWPGEGRPKERRLKRSGGASRYCPICRALKYTAAAPTLPLVPPRDSPGEVAQAARERGA